MIKQTKKTMFCTGYKITYIVKGSSGILNQRLCVICAQVLPFEPVGFFNAHF